MGKSSADIRRAGGELEPDFSSRPVVTDPIEIGGPDSTGPDNVAETGETYTPPDDPVLTTDAHGRPKVLGGFDSSSDDAEVDVSSDGVPGDESLADPVLRDLPQDP